MGGCYLEVLPRLEPARRLERVGRPAPPRKGAGPGRPGRPYRAGLPPPRAEDPRLQALDRLLRGDRQGLDRGAPRHHLHVLGRPRQRLHASLRARPPGPKPRLRALFLAESRAEPPRPRGRRPPPVLMPTHVLGISCFYHDAAAALLKDGEIVAACQEERLSRKKHDSEFPARAVRYVLKEAGIGPERLDAVGFYDKPLLKFERMLSTYVATFPRSFNSFRKAIPVWLHQKLWVPSLIRKELKPYKGPILFAEHHMSHAASCFLPSPFEEAAILTVDGVGEWATASFGVGKGRDITLFKEIRFPHSLGLLYSAFTYYLGFKVNSAEYKVMGLAPYGKPVHFDRIMKEIVHLNEDGSFKLNMKYFSYDYGLTMTNGAFSDFFGGPPRKPETWMTEREFDIAASIQKVCEEIVLRETPFKELFVQPAAGDAGGSVGVAHYVYNTLGKQPRGPAWTHAYLGPEYDDAEIREYLDGQGAKYGVLSDGDIVRETARLIADGNVIGWFQGRMEFGPRALGGRSILADPRDPGMRD